VRPARDLLGTLLALAVVTCMAAPTMALAQEPMTAADVVALSPDRDGEQVTLSGEAIGDVMRATTGGVWVNVLSGGTAVGVWTTAESAAAIQTLGDHKHTGDTVLVTGTFNFACDLHGGDLDVHADSFEVVERGGPRDLVVEWWKVGAAALIGLVALLLAILYRRRPEAG
jgi:hypothetical protein